MTQHYSNPARESDLHALPNVETFYVDAQALMRDPIDGALHELTEPGQSAHDCDRDGCEPALPGWYWQACFPGCLPDGDPIGPFATEAEALADARESAGE